jgi:hypothetical protein
MNRANIALLLCALAVSPAATGGIQSPEAAPSFRSSVDIVAMNVTVTDPERRFVADLSRDDFSGFRRWSASTGHRVPEEERAAGACVTG